MRADYDPADPLQILFQEWSQVGIWFWTFLAAGGMVAFALPDRPVVAILIAVAGLGQALLRLGHALIVAANEVRKELRATAGTAVHADGPAGDQAPGL